MFIPLSWTKAGTHKEHSLASPLRLVRTFIGRLTTSNPCFRDIWSGFLAVRPKREIKGDWLLQCGQKLPLTFLSHLGDNGYVPWHKMAILGIRAWFLYYSTSYTWAYSVFYSSYWSHKMGLFTNRCPFPCRWQCPIQPPSPGLAFSAVYLLPWASTAPFQPTSFSQVGTIPPNPGPARTCAS